VSETNQVGYGYGPVTSYQEYALLWSGSAESAIDLHPPGYFMTQVFATSGPIQVGSGAADVPGQPHKRALLWHGSAESVIDMTPPGYVNSGMTSIAGDSYGGDADGHAILWHGTRENFVDLHPAGFKSSHVRGLSAAGQVGAGAISPSSGIIVHALYWNGSAASAIDLHTFLTGLGKTFTSSEARGISDNGTIIGYATTADHRSQAILWTPVPEPNFLSLSAVGTIACARLRRRPSARDFRRAI
jgi:probable HAF family extracellular repeat protein